MVTFLLLGNFVLSVIVIIEYIKAKNKVREKEWEILKIKDYRFLDEVKMIGNIRRLNEKLEQAEALLGQRRGKYD